MKKFLAALLCAISAFALLSLSGCKNKAETVNVYVVDGAPVLSVANILSEEELDGVKLNVKIVPSADNLIAAMTNKEADIAVCPINLASALYNKVRRKTFIGQHYGRFAPCRQNGRDFRNP